METFKNYIINIIKTIFITLLLVIVLIYLTDIDGYFGGESFSYESQLAKYLLNDEAILSSQMVQEDALKYWMSNNFKAVEYVLTGSSRGYLISNKYLNSSLANYSVGAAGLKDHIAYINLAIKRQNPKTIVISVDPWMFRDKYAKPLSPLMNDYYLKGLKEAAITPEFRDYLLIIKNKYQQLISLNYLLKSLERLFFFKNKFFKITSADCDAHKKYLTICSDGSFRYSLEFSERNVVEVSAEVEKQFGHTSLKNYTEVNYDFSTQKFNDFVKFVNHISKDRNIIILLAPFHPIAYEQIKFRTPTFFISEDLLRPVVFNSSVKLIGSYSATELRCGVEDFYDAYHPKISCFKKFF